MSTQNENVARVHSVAFMCCLRFASVSDCVLIESVIVHILRTHDRLTDDLVD